MSPETFWQLISLAAFLSGLLFGNWLAIGRDRRTEFNDLANRLRPKIAHFNTLSDHQIWLLKSRTPLPRRIGISKAIDRYHQAIQDQNHGQLDPKTGKLEGYIGPNTIEREKATNAMLRIIELR